MLFTLLTDPAGGEAPSLWQIAIQSVHTGERTIIAENGSDARYVPSGHILYVADGVLTAVPFDTGTMRPAGPPVPVVRGIQAANFVNATMHYGVADNGTLVYVPGQPLPARMALDLVITDRAGGLEHLYLPPAAYETPRVSPDKRHVAVSTDDGREATVWVKELSGTSVMRRLTIGGRSRLPVWSPDSRRIAFQSDRGGDLGIYVQAADGSDTPQRLTAAAAGAAHIPESWSAGHLLFTEMRNEEAALFVLSLTDNRVAPFGEVTSATPTTATFAPDGRWIAYNTAPSRGALHTVYVQPFPASGAKYAVSHNDGGHHPVWSDDGRELVYIPRPFQLFATKIAMSPFSIGSPTQIPPAGLMGPGIIPRQYDFIDERRFIGRQVAVDDAARAGAPPRIQLVTHWFGQLEPRRE